MSQYKHLSFQDRIRVEELLEKKVSINMIAKDLKKSRSTIAREIQRNRYKVSEPSYRIHPCIHQKSCERMHVCGDESCSRYCNNCSGTCNTNNCKDYVPQQCRFIENSPFVCNGCERIDITMGNNACRYIKFKYQAKSAQLMYEEKLTESRSGISFSPSELAEIDNLVSPLLLNGQSISTVFLAYQCFWP